MYLHCVPADSADSLQMCSQMRMFERTEPVLHASPLHLIWGVAAIWFCEKAAAGPSSDRSTTTRIDANRSNGKERSGPKAQALAGAACYGHVWPVWLTDVGHVDDPGGP